MKTFFKLNIISALLAFILLIQFQPSINSYRIVRITNLSFKSVNAWISIFNISLFIISTIMFFFIMKKRFNSSVLRFLSTVLWMPYYIVFTKIVNSLFPITYRGDKPALVIGLLIMGAFIIYPFYIAFLLVLSSSESKLKRVILESLRGLKKQKASN